MLSSDWAGIALGSILGAYQPFVLFDDPVLPIFSQEELLLVILFGLAGPPILASLHKFIPVKQGGMEEKIGQHVNLIFLFSAYGMATGTVGLLYYFVIGVPQAAFFPICFFGAAGIGFFLGFLVNPKLAYRPEDGTKQ